MGWADRHIEKLQAGETVTFRPHGNSMYPLIASGDQVEVIPLGDVELVVGDVVLCRVRGQQYLHLVKGLDGDQVQIGNNKGHINGWTPRDKCFGRVVRITTG